MYGVQIQLVLSGMGQSKLKLSGNGNECMPLADGTHARGEVGRCRLNQLNPCSKRL